MNLIPIKIPMEVSVPDTAVPMSIASDRIVVGLSIGAEYKIGVPDVYEGEYEIVPKARESQILETANKIMEEDVLIFEVPYFQTSNEYGDTVYIASEV